MDYPVIVFPPPMDSKINELYWESSLLSDLCFLSLAVFKDDLSSLFPKVAFVFLNESIVVLLLTVEICL